MHRPHALIAGLIASSWLGCAGPIECPGERIAEGEACVCPRDAIGSADGTCAFPQSDDARAGGEVDRQVSRFGDAGVDLDAALRPADLDAQVLAADSIARPDACAADAAYGDAATREQAGLEER